MYPPAEGFQCLCISCSDTKTKIEDEMREYYKQKRKKELEENQEN